MDSPNKLEQLLLDCLKKNPNMPEPISISNYSIQDWNNFLGLAKIHRVISLLCHRLKEKHLNPLLPEAIQTALKDAYRQNTMRNLRLYGELRQLAAMLHNEGIPAIVLKGMVLAEDVYGNIALREMNDIDLLARKHDLSYIKKILETIGYKALQPISIDCILEDYHHLSPMTKAGKAPIEIHWNLTAPGMNYSIDPTELWHRAYPVKLAGCDLLQLCPEDLLLHICMHTSYQHQFAFSLRPLCDIAELLERYDDHISWADIIDRARRWGWQRGIYLVLQLTKELIGANIPNSVIREMQPKGISEDIINTAKRQIFMNSSFAGSIKKPFVQLILSNNLLTRFKIFLNRIFLSKRNLASCYSLDPNFPWIHLYYIRRFIDVLRRHSHTMSRVLNHEADIIEFAQRKSEIDRFLLEN